MLSTAPYLQWGLIFITIPNLIVIGLMVLVFLIAAIVRLPGHKD
jgi:hypothetical protein